MRSRKLGEIDVGPVGLGCMGMTYGYTTGMTGEQTRIEVIRQAVRTGATMIDTADVYGPYTSEELVGRALKGCRDEAVISTKVGEYLAEGPDGPALFRNGRPDYLKNAVQESLRRLGTDHIDICYLHRIDPAVPLQESWGALAELVAAGQLRAIGLSGVRPAEVEVARRIHPVTAVQNELSIFFRDDELVEWTARNGVTLVTYASLGRGLLAGRFASPDDLDEDDMRRMLSRLAAPHLPANLAIVEGVRAVADRHGATLAQISLAWVLAQGGHVVPIPGLKRPEYLVENLGATAITLTTEDLAEIAALPVASGDPL